MNNAELKDKLSSLANTVVETYNGVGDFLEFDKQRNALLDFWLANQDKIRWAFWEGEDDGNNIIICKPISTGESHSS